METSFRVARDSSGLARMVEKSKCIVWNFTLAVAGLEIKTYRLLNHIINVHSKLSGACFVCWSSVSRCEISNGVLCRKRTRLSQACESRECPVRSVSQSGGAHSDECYTGFRVEVTLENKRHRLF